MLIYSLGFMVWVEWGWDWHGVSLVKSESLHFLLYEVSVPNVNSVDWRHYHKTDDGNQNGAAAVRLSCGLCL